jgi:RNA polymerase sigma factor (sigma-70 family)
MPDLNIAYASYNLHPTETTLTDLFAACRCYALTLAYSFRFADAEESAQGATVKLWESLSRYDASRGEFKPWARTLLRNHYLDLYRRAKPQRLHPPTVLDESVLAPSVGHSEASLDMTGLTPAQRHTLRVFADLQDFEMTAAELGITVSTLKKRISKIKSKTGTK